MYSRRAGDTLEKAPYSLTAEIAGIPVLVRCRFASNAERLEDYRTDREPLITAEALPEDTALALGSQPAAAPRREEEAESLALLLCLCRRLMDYGVLLLHGSALTLDGQGYVFTAPSGTGKSTHARLWRETFGDRVRMLNDDKPLLRISREGVEIFGTPWMGKHGLGCPGRAPLKAIVCLKRGEDNTLEPMDPKRAFSVLHSQAFGMKDPRVMAGSLPLKKALAERVPFFRLNMNNLREDAALRCLEGLNKYG